MRRKLESIAQRASNDREVAYNKLTESSKRVDTMLTELLEAKAGKTTESQKRSDMESLIREAQSLMASGIKQAQAAAKANEGARPRPPTTLVDQARFLQAEVDRLKRDDQVTGPQIVSLTKDLNDAKGASTARAPRSPLTTSSARISPVSG